MLHDVDPKVLLSLGCEVVVISLFYLCQVSPVSSPSSAPRPKAHLFWPPALVVELEGGVLQGLERAGDLYNAAPDVLRVARPALDLMRLQKRFRGRVILVSDSPRDWALWVAGVLGWNHAVMTVPEGGGARAKARFIAPELERRGYDVLGSREFVGILGPAARRGWVAGHDEALQARLLTAGVPTYQVDDGDCVPVADLMAPAVSGWTVEPSATEQDQRAG